MNLQKMFLIASSVYIMLEVWHESTWDNPMNICLASQATFVACAELQTATTTLLAVNQSACGASA